MPLKLIADHMMAQQIDAASITCTWGRGIYRISTETGKIVEALTIPRKYMWSTLIGDLISRPCLRFLNHPGIDQLLLSESGTLAALYDKIYIFGKNRTYCGSGDYSGSSFHGPLTRGAMIGATGEVIWGEYQNGRPAAPRIVRFFPTTGKVESVYAFSLGDVKHVHSVFYDTHRDCHWICTGDNDGECGLFYTKDGFRTVECLGRGDQGWRMVSLIVLNDRLVWGSDLGADVQDRSQANAIYQYDFQSCRRTKLQEVQNPIYYSYVTPQGRILFGTTYEPGSVVGIDMKASILCSISNKQWKEVVSLPYHPVKRSYGTKYSTIFFPKGQGSDERVFFTAYNVQEYDCCLLSLDLQKVLK